VNLRAVDLNLLVIFDALMRERHVTRAAQRIPMSQPAMSNALARLRHLFKDDLFIRSAGGMEPTPRAAELADAIRQILRQAERLMLTDAGFDPATTQRDFTARMSDLVGYLALPGLLRELHAQAPGIALNVLHLSPEHTLAALEGDQLDFALSMALPHAANIRSAALFSDRMVCVMRAGHPLAAAQLTLARFLAAEHLRVAMSPTDIRFVDAVLADRDQKRRVAANVPHWLLIPPILRQTDLVAVISGKLAAHFAPAEVTVKPLPFSSEPFAWTLYWHRRHDNNQPHKWMRELIMASCRDL
jgi:DNA-binding transcriptional LysR family regulator